MLIRWGIKARQALITLRHAQFAQQTGRFDEALEKAKAAFALGEALDDLAIKVDALEQWGRNAEEKRDHKTALPKLKESVRLARELGDPERLARSLNSLSVTYEHLNQFDEQYTYLQEAIALAEEINDTKLTPRLLNNLQIYFSRTDDYKRTNEYAEKALALIKAIGDRYGEAIAYVNRGIDFFFFGDYARARDFEKKSAELFNEIDSRDGVDLCLMFLMLIAVRCKEYDETQRMLEAGVESAKASGYAVGKGVRQGYLGYLHQSMGNYSLAAQLFQQASTLLETLGTDHEVALIRYFQATSMVAQEKWAEAAKLYEQVLTILPDGPASFLWTPAHTGWAAVQLALGDVGSALAKTEVVLPYLLNQPLIDGWHDFRCAWQAYQVLKTTHDSRAQMLLQRVYTILQERAERLESGDVRNFYLTGVKWHRNIVKEYEVEVVSTPPPAIIETINGRYRLHEKLGEGGMGRVYLATDRLTGDIVALKQVHLADKQEVSDSFSPGAAEDELRLALAHEFQILAGLRHPHIISVLDYGFDSQKRPFFTMSYLPDGETILDAGQDAPFEQKIELIQQLLQGLAYLHRRGVLHRDLKPDNVLVTDNHVRVLDFGLSASEQVGSDSVGTPLYMAPELFDGQAYSQAADLYTAGVILYQLLTGKHPFEPFDFRFLDRVLGEKPDFADVDERLRPFLNQLLAKTPEARFESATAALTEIAKALGQSQPAETFAIRESYLQAAKFVGRDTEMAQLADSLTLAANGRGSAWLIGGESGVGKTRLISELRTLALVQGFHVLHGQGLAEGGGAPYQLWRHPLRQLIVTLPEIDDLTAGILLPLVPDMAQLLARPVESAPELEEEAAQVRLFTTIARLFWQAKQPLLLILEDLHMAEASLKPLPYLTRLVDEHKLFILASYRIDERPSLTEQLPSEFLQLSLARLTPTALADLSFAMLGEAGQSDGVLSLLQRETEGNAFFAVEVVRALAEDVGRLGDIGQVAALPQQLFPDGIQTIVDNRLQRLPAAALPLLQLAASAGRELDLALVQALANDIDVKAWWLPACSDAAILNVQNGRWQFAHDKIRQGVLQPLAPALRVNCHMQIAQSLEAIYPDLPEMAVTIAYHWQKANNPVQERLYRLTAVVHSLEQYAFEDALSNLDRAFNLTPDEDQAAQFDIVNKQVATLHHLGKKEQEAALLPKLLGIAETIGEPAHIISANASQIEYQNIQGDFEASARLAQQIVERFEGQDDVSLIEIYPLWAWSYRGQGKSQETLAILDRAKPILYGSDTLQEVRALIIRGNAEFRLGNLEDSIKSQKAALALSQKLGLKTRIISALNNLGNVYIQSNQVDKAIEYYEQALERNQQIGNQELHVALLTNMGICQYIKHDFAQFMVLTQEAMALAKATGNQIKEAIAAENLGHSSATLGRYEEGLKYAQQSLNIVQKIAQNDAYLLGNVWFGVGENLFYLERWDEAEEAFQAALTFRKERDIKEAIIEIQAWLARASLAKGNRSDAIRHIQPVLAFLRQKEVSSFDHLFFHFVAYEVLQAEHLTQANQHLIKAYSSLKAEAETIADDAVRQTFWNEVVLHREIVKLHGRIKKEKMAVSTSPQILDTINGRYVLKDKLGEGGMGRVYLATDRLTGDIVALKQVHLADKQEVSDSFSPGAAEDELRLALAHEFQILAGLRHPHIISVLDYGFDGENRPFFTMTYLPESQNILEAAQDRSFEQKIGLVQQLLQGLAYLHRRAVLHRDLKPDNVLVTDGHVRVLDFGLSTSEKMGSDSVGTPLYMAPELFEEHDYSQAADLYAVGVILYQLLTGQHPFEPFDFSFLDRVLESEPDVEIVDERIRPFLTQLLAKTAAKRFANANDALIQLAESLHQPPPPETAAIRESYLQAAKFVGRDTEIAQLTEALQSAAAGNGSAWLIGGESGVGKTRVMNELRTQALVSGFQVLRGQGVAEGGGLPYQIWREPLRHLIALQPTVDDLTASVLLPLVPNMEALINRPVSPAPELNEKATLTRLYLTISQLFWQVERPLLLIIEDLHLTEASLLPLPTLIREISSQKLLILGSYRSDERPDLAATLTEMTHMPLSRLSSEAMADLSVAMLGDIGRDDAVQSMLQRETEGNAFFAVEVVRALAELAGRLDHIGQMTLPETLLPNGIQDIVQRRVSQLPDAARRLLVKTAVAGRELHLSVIEQLADGMDLVNEWLPLCADAAILEVQNGVWQFSHGKLRDGLLQELRQDERRAQHRDVALAIETIYPEAPAQAAVLAYHWRYAGDEEKERDYSLLAGQFAADQFANKDALKFYDQALALTPISQPEKRYDILLAREVVHNLMGERSKQQIDFEEMVELADHTDNLRWQAVVALRQAEFNTRTARFDEAIRLGERVIELAKQLDDQELLVDGHIWCGQAYDGQKAFEPARAQLQIAVDGARELKDLPRLSLALNGLGIVFDHLGKFDDQRVCLEEALSIAKQLNDVRLESHIYNNLQLHYGHLDDYDHAQEYSEKALNLYQEIGDSFGVAIGHVNRGIDLYMLGDYQMAWDYTVKSITLFRMIDDDDGDNLALFFLSLCSERLKRTADAWPIIDEAVSVSQTLGRQQSEGERLGYQGYLCYQQADYEQAATLYQQAVDCLIDIPAATHSLATIRFQQGLLASRQQVWDRAGEHYQQAVDLIKDAAYTPLRTPCLSGLGVVALMNGKVQEAVATIEPVVAHLLNRPLIDGWHDPRVSLECLQVLEAAGDDRTELVLARSAELLYKRADDLSLTARQIYLDVPEHRTIIQLHEQKLAKAKTVVSPLSDPLIEIINGRYHLHEKLGEGGMGIVYRATDRLTGEIVALKQVHLSENLQVHDSLAPGATEDDLRLALAHEFQILAGLRHPHIISVLDYGFDEEKRPFFTMNYLPESQTLLDAGQALSLDDKIILMQQLLQALTYLHRHGVLHHDLKPGNVLVSNGLVQVLDFGLSDSERMGSSGSGGTVLYMAPELYEGGLYTKSADLYAAGVLFYQLLTGKHPFAPLDHTFVDKVLENQPDFEGIDEQLRPFLAQLLAKQPEQRFVNATMALYALAEALQQPHPPESKAIRESYLQAAKFVGREAEMAQLISTLEAAKTEQGAVLLVGGEAGVGKTRLLDEFRVHALVNGWQVLNGNAVAGGGLPYQLWQDVIPHLALGGDLNDLEAGVLYQIVPRIERLLARPIPAPPMLQGAAIQQRLVFTLISVLQRQTKPTLLLLEDLHWVRESIAPMQQMLNLLDQLPGVCVVATYRSDERTKITAKAARGTAAPPGSPRGKSSC